MPDGTAVDSLAAVVRLRLSYCQARRHANLFLCRDINTQGRKSGIWACMSSNLPPFGAAATRIVKSLFS